MHAGGAGNGTFTMWRQWRPQVMASKRVRRRYYFDDGCHGYCSPYVLPGLVVTFLILGLCFLIAGFATQYWVYYEEGTEGELTYKEIYFGMWTQCNKDGVKDVVCAGMLALNLPDFMTACQALAIISLIGLILILGFLTYWLCSYHRNIYLKITLLLAQFITFLVILCAVIVFRVKGEDYVNTVLLSYNAGLTNFNFSWSFYMYAVSAAFTLFAGCFMMCIPAYGRHSEVFGDRVAIKEGPPVDPGFSTPPPATRASYPAAVPAALPRYPPAVTPQYPAVTPQYPLVTPQYPLVTPQYPLVAPRSIPVQGYGTRGYLRGSHSDSSGYPGLVRPDGFGSIPRPTIR